MFQIFSDVYYTAIDYAFPPSAPGEQWRERARSEAQLRARALANAREAYLAGRPSEATSVCPTCMYIYCWLNFVKLSEDGNKYHGKRVELYNRRAASAAFAHYNTEASLNGIRGSSIEQRNTKSTSKIDLHGLFVNEAKQYASEHIDKCRKQGVERVIFVTGRGNRSVDGVAKIKPAIRELLERKGIAVEVDQRNEGVLIGVLRPADAKNDEGWGCVVM